MKNYLRNWNFMRFARLAMGIFVAVQGFLYNEWIFVILGGLFALMPLMNVGCCVTNTYSAPRQTRKNEEDEIHYEEIK